MGLTDTTTYRVETLYVTRDEASRGLHGIAGAAEHAHSSTALLKHALEAVGAGLTLEKAKHAFIDFNSEVQNAKISLSTMLQGNYSVDWKTATEGASGLYAEFQRFSQLTPVTTQEMLEFGRGVTVATAQAGGSIRDITNITEQGVVAAKALGMESNYASLELTEMLMGNVSRRMRFAQQILGFARMDEKEFKKLSAGERMNVIERVLNSPAMKNATTAFSTSFSGVLSTLEDKLQILGGRVGLPLFQAVTREISHWNEWIDKNQEKVDAFISSVGTGLVHAFETVKNVFEFLYDHADVLIAIAKAYAAIKIGGAIGGAASSMLGSIGRLGGIDGTVAGVAGFARAAAPAAAVGVGAYEIATLAGADKLGQSLGHSFAHLTGRTNEYADRIDETTQASAALAEAQRRAAYKLVPNGEQTFASRLEGTMNQRAQQIAALETILHLTEKNAGIDGAFEYFASSAAKRDLFDMHKDEFLKVGLTNSDFDMAGGLMPLLTSLREQQNAAGGRQEFAGMGAIFATTIAPLIGLQQNQLTEAKTLNDLFGAFNRQLASGRSIFDKAFLTEIMGDLKKGANDPFKGQAKVNQNITNHIQVEVSAKDPDRWIAELDAKVTRKMRAPTQAKGSIIGGM